MTGSPAEIGAGGGTANQETSKALGVAAIGAGLRLGNCDGLPVEAGAVLAGTVGAAGLGDTSASRIRILAQEAARHAKRAFGLFDVDWFGKHEIGADAISLGHSSLSFDQSDSERTLIETGISRALEEQGSVLLVLTVHDDGVITLRHQLLDGGERLVDRFDGEVQVAENVTYDAG